MLRALLFPTLTFAALGALAAPAAAQTLSGGAEGTPVLYARRGMVLEPGTLRLDFAPQDFGLRYGGIGGRSYATDVPGVRIGRHQAAGPGGVFTSEEALFQLTLGAAYGVVDGLEVGTVLMPIYVAPDGDFGDIELYGRYRFLSEDNAQVGAQLTLAIPTFSNFGIGIGVPVQLRFGPARVDTGVELELLFSDDGSALDLDLPVAISIDILDGFFGGVRSGFFARDFDDLAIPLQGHIGYTLINGNAPFVDFVASFGWPRFIWTGPGDSLDLGTFDVLLGARVFFAVQ